MTICIWNQIPSSSDLLKPTIKGTLDLLDMSKHPAIESARGLEATEEAGRRTHKREQKINRSAQDHFYSMAETEMHAAPGVLGQSKPTLLPEITTPPSTCTPCARPCLL